jgi:hypothetical protein
MKLFTDWLNENQEPLKSFQDIEALMPQIIEAAQQAYDEWEQDEDGQDPELGAGGICQDIASKIAEVFETHGIEASTVSAHIGDQHVWTIIKLKEGVFNVDIPPQVYEIGSVYTWKKRPNVKFVSDHINFKKVDSDPNTFEDFLDY